MRGLGLNSTELFVVLTVTLTLGFQLIILSIFVDQSFAITDLHINKTQNTQENTSQFKHNTANISVGIVKHSFTIAAYGQLKPDNPEPIYNQSFYNFYRPYYSKLETGEKVTTDIANLTVKISPKASSLNEEFLPQYMRVVSDMVRDVFPNSNISYLNDENVHDGLIFTHNNSLANAYDILIIYHEEYVTPQEYYNFKKFVQNGGILIVMDGNIFYGEVKYDKANGLLTLVEGHGVKFDGKAAVKSVRERWENETREWIGSNFYEFSNRQYGPVYVNNPFNYSMIEDMYTNNPNVKIILDYGSSDPRYNVTTYEIDYGEGKVITIGLFGSSLSFNPLFKQFFKELLITYAVPNHLQNMTTDDGIHYYNIPPLLRFTPTSSNSSDLSLQLIVNGSNKSPIYHLKGSTNDEFVHFKSQNIYYTGKDFSLTIGTVFKYGDFLYQPNEPRIVFVFDILGKNSTYQLDFVHGKPVSEGWSNNIYYKNIESKDTISIDAQELLELKNDDFVAMTKVQIKVEENLILNPLEFRVDFSTDTLQS